MEIISQLLVALSLCADSFAVSLCSGVTIGRINVRSVVKVALTFAVIHTGFLLAGWAFGNLLAGFISKLTHIVGFLLLLYVGGSMLLDALRGKEEIRDLRGIANVVLAGIATSIDALAVGAAQSMEARQWAGFLPLLLAVFILTVLSVSAGIAGGKRIGVKFGRVAELCGGVVLVTIGVLVLL